MEWLSKKSGKSYRLPKEDEWKYACDGGQEHQYCGGEDLGSLGWYDGNSGGKTHPVGQKRANGYGLYDMSGNAWERMQECWGGIARSVSCVVALGSALRGAPVRPTATGTARLTGTSATVFGLLVLPGPIKPWPH